jgi:hypothetical protein
MLLLEEILEKQSVPELTKQVSRVTPGAATSVNSSTSFNLITVKTV